MLFSTHSPNLTSKYSIYPFSIFILFLFKLFSLPWQHSEITRVSLIFVADYVPVGVVHLDALPNRSTQRAGLQPAAEQTHSNITSMPCQESDLTKHTVLSFCCDSCRRIVCLVPYFWLSCESKLPEVQLNITHF